MNYDNAVTVLVEQLYNSDNDTSQEMVFEAMKYLVEQTECPDTKFEYLEDGEFLFYEADLNVIHKKKAQEIAFEAFNEATNKLNKTFIKEMNNG